MDNHEGDKLHPLGCLSEVVVVKASENRSRPDRAERLREITKRNLLVYALMKAFGVIAIDVFGENTLDHCIDSK